MSDLPSNRHGLLLAGLAFAIILVFGYGADLALQHYPRWWISDDLILAVVSAIVVYQYEKQRSRLLSEKLRVIRDMNSYVRNELQILYASVEQSDKTRLETVQRSVERIDWALREILPGKEIPVATSVEDVGQPVAKKIERSA